jgi:hypothetical protein
MKQDSKHWLNWKGTREGNRMVYARPYIPARETNLRETFERVRRDNAYAAWLESKVNYETGI